MCFILSSTVFLSLPKTSLQTALGQVREQPALRLDNDSMKKELDFWTKSTTMGARDWCDRLRQAEQKFREAAEKNARLEEALRDLNSKLDQLALMTNCARAVCFEAKAASASA